MPTRMPRLSQCPGCKAEVPVRRMCQAHSHFPGRRAAGGGQSSHSHGDPRTPSGAHTVPRRPVVHE